MRFSDAFAKSLLACGVTRGYGLQGGLVAHLIDSFAGQGGVICFDYHKQHSALAATVVEGQAHPDQPSFWSFSVDTAEGGTPIALPLSTMNLSGACND